MVVMVVLVVVVVVIVVVLVVVIVSSGAGRSGWCGADSGGCSSSFLVFSSIYTLF